MSASGDRPMETGRGVDAITPIANPVTATVAKAYLRWKTRSVEKFIFVASTGRSGTGFLARAFDRIDGCVSLHEPYPIMHSHVMRAKNHGDPRPAERAFRLRKEAYIRAAARDARWYMESNHFFIKSFADLALEAFGHRLAVIHLRRDAIAVAKSLLDLGTIPGSRAGRPFYLDYRAPGNLIRIAPQLSPGGAFDDDFYRCLWYWHEIERRIEAFKPQISTAGAVWQELFWRSRIEADAVRSVMEALGLPGEVEPEPERVNTKASQKTRRSDAYADLAGMAERFADFLGTRA